MGETGLSLTNQPPVSTAATVTADAPASVVWQRLASDGLADRIETAVKSLTSDMRPGQRALALEEMGVTAINGLFASAISNLADEDPIRDQWKEQARRSIEEYGTAEGSVLGVHAPMEEIADGPLAVLSAADISPTVAINVTKSFESLRAGQRRDIADLFASLAEVCDLRIVATGYQQAKLKYRYHERIPVNRPCNASPSEGEVATRVEAARAAFDPDGRETKIIRSIIDEPSETVTYHALYAESNASKSRVRQCIGRLADHNLVAVFSGGSGRMVEVREEGRAYLDTIDSGIGRQQSLLDAVSDPQNRGDEDVLPLEQQSRESAPPTAGCDDSGSERGGWTNARYLSRHHHAAIAGMVDEADICLSDHPISGAGRSPVISYDDDRDELVVGAEFRGSLQWVVTTARALAGPKMWSQILTPDRLDELPPWEVWVKCSQGGWCMNGGHTNAGYVGRLRQAREEILDATTEYRQMKDNGEDEEADELARWIMRQSQGLIGTVTRMLDYCGVAITRYIQLPEYASDWHTSENHRRRRSIFKTIAKASTVSGKYGAYTAERTMFEPRPQKRDFVLGTPTVTSNESGQLVGSWSIIGRGVSKMLNPTDGPGLRDALEDPAELQEDGENFAVFDVPLTIHADRTDEAVQSSIQRMCEQKNIRATDIGRRILHGCVGSVMDITRALNHLAPEPEDMRRDIRLDEIRRALATVPSGRLLADTPSRSVGKLLKTMLNTTKPLSQTELANKADVSTQTVRNNTETLEALAIVERTETEPGEPVEWRCSLPHRDERGARGTEALNPRHRATDGIEMGAFQRMVADLTKSIADDEVNEAFGTEIRDLNTLVERCPELRPWLQIAATLGGMKLDTSEYASLVFGRNAITCYGETPSQASLTASQAVAN